MKVKIGDKIYNGHDEPIMIILDEMDKQNIVNMGDQDRYCEFPANMTRNEIRVFMGLEPIKKEEK